MDNILNSSGNINKDVDEINLDGNTYTYALNATVEDFDGKNFLLGNTPSNYLLSLFKEEEKVMGKMNIFEKNLILFFTNDGFNSYIKYIQNVNFLDENSNWEYSTWKDCLSAETQTPLEQKPLIPLIEVKTLATSSCFKFFNPLQIVYKITDCNINLYFVDGIEEDRYIYFNSDTFKITEEFLQ